MFWRLYASGELTSLENKKDSSEWSSKEDAANLELWKIAIPISFAGELSHPLARDKDALTLKGHVQPDADVKVILPLLVNHRAIDAKYRLLFHRVLPVEAQTAKRAAGPVDPVTA